MSCENDQEHGVQARDYLARARSCLVRGTPECLFYAALEFRCGIEARFQEYLDAQRENKAKIKQGWRMAKLAANLKRHFATGDKVIRITMRDTEGRSYSELLYTPVTARLQKMGERLGDLLHAQTRYREPADPWWIQAREFLETVAAELEKAVQGNLLGAPLWNPRTSQVFMVIQPRPDESVEVYKPALERIGQRLMADVEYLDDVPPYRPSSPS